MAQQRRGFYAEFFDYVDDLPAQELTPHAGALVASLDQPSLLGAIDTATRLFLDELQRGAPDLAERLKQPLLDVVRGDDQRAQPMGDKAPLETFGRSSAKGSSST